MRLVRTVFMMSAVSLLAACSTLQQMMDVKEPDARVAGVSLSALSLDAATLLVDVEVSNPNGFTLNTAGFDLDLAVAGENIARVQQPDAALSVPAKGSNSVKLPVTVNFRDIIAAAGAIKDKKSVDYALNGKVTVNLPVLGDVSLPLNFADALPVPKLPELKFRDASLKSVNWSGAEMLVSLDVTNPNLFGIDLNSLSYALKAQGKDIGSGALNGIHLGEDETQTLNIPLSVSLTTLGISLFRMLTGDEDVTVGLDANADVAPDLGIWKPEPMSFTAERKLSR